MQIKLLANWESAVISTGALIQDAMESLNLSCAQIVLVADNDGRLVGTITDGDIRRAILNGCDVKSFAHQIMNERPLVAPACITKAAALELMKINKIRHLPKVNAAGAVNGLYTIELSYSPPALDNELIIMAGGIGKRLRPQTNNCPKPMLKVGGKPVLELILERALNAGIKKVTISVNYLRHMVEDYFGDGSAFGLDITYLREDKPLGTAGALSGLKISPTKPFFIMNGDLISEVNFQNLLDFHVSNGADATMTVRSHETQNPYGVVLTEGLKIVGLEEKPSYRANINAGIYVLNPSALKMLPKKQFFDMPDLVDRLLTLEKKVLAYSLHEPWIDIGNLKDLSTARKQA